MRTIRKTAISNHTHMPGLRRILTILGVNAAAWTALSAFAALMSWNEDLREGLHSDYWNVFEHWMRSSLVLASLSGALYLVFTYRPAWMNSGRRIVLSYLGLLLVLLPLQLLHLLIPTMGDDGIGMSWQALQQAISHIDHFASLLRFSTTTAVYFAVVGLKAWQLGKARQLEVERAKADSQALRSELAQQRAMALRAQLEPHFLFNALGAISALVRAQKSDIALDGIHDLGELLRYALEASNKEWTSIADELAFVEQYLSLQRLRYGDRLQLRIEGLDAQLLSCDMLPLLLQPLVENAIRHDLDCHTGPSDILIRFQLRDGQVHVQISNPVHPARPANPGVGLGLRSTAARIRSAYGETAKFAASTEQGSFHVDLHFPQYAPS
jgi:two-component system sensor histidine kinase AlgZ